MTTDIMSLPEVCEYLKLTKSTVYKLSQRGDLPSSRIGRQLRFRKSRVDSWLDSREIQKAKKAKKSARR